MSSPTLLLGMTYTRDLDKLEYTRFPDMLGRRPIFCGGDVSS